MATLMRVIGSGPNSGTVVVVIGKCSASNTFIRAGEFVVTTCISR